MCQEQKMLQRGTFHQWPASDPTRRVLPAGEQFIWVSPPADPSPPPSHIHKTLEMRCLTGARWREKRIESVSTWVFKTYLICLPVNIYRLHFQHSAAKCPVPFASRVLSERTPASFLTASSRWVTHSFFHSKKRLLFTCQLQELWASRLTFSISTCFANFIIFWYTCHNATYTTWVKPTLLWNHNLHWGLVLKRTTNQKSGCKKKKNLLNAKRSQQIDVSYLHKPTQASFTLEWLRPDEAVGLCLESWCVTEM